LKYLIEMADECRLLARGYRLRFTRSNRTLLIVMGAIDANPALRFQMTMDETGVCWVNVERPDDTARANSAPRAGGIPVVA